MPGRLRVRPAGPEEESTAQPTQHIRPQAFDRQAVEHLPSLQRAARRLARNAPEADDLVQETYVRALRSFGHFRPGTNLKAWLLTILRHAHLNRLRDSARAIVDVDEAKVERFAEIAKEGSTPEQRLLESAMDDELRIANASLPLSLRQTLWLRDIEELPYAEIAKRLGIPVGTVMSRLSRARRLLYERLTR
jgi:RNA polymerase sigma-70 factor (ECF subfamily)